MRIVIGIILTFLISDLEKIDSGIVCASIEGFSKTSELKIELRFCEDTSYALFIKEDKKNFEVELFTKDKNVYNLTSVFFYKQGTADKIIFTDSTNEKYEFKINRTSIKKISCYSEYGITREKEDLKCDAFSFEGSFNYKTKIISMTFKTEIVM